MELDGFAPEPLDSEKLLKVSNPLEEASKFVQPLLQLNSKELGAYLFGFEVYYRKKKAGFDFFFLLICCSFLYRGLL